MLCESLVLSNFNYCDYLYGPCLDQLEKDRIQKVQNNCLRLMFGLRKYDHISYTFREVNWLNMSSRRTLHLGTFLIKVIKNPVVPSTLKEKLVFRLSIHSRHIRFTDKLTLPHHKTAMFRRSFIYNSIKLYNSLPDDIKKLSEKQFNTEYKKLLLQLQNS